MNKQNLRRLSNNKKKKVGSDTKKLFNKLYSVYSEFSKSYEIQKATDLNIELDWQQLEEELNNVLKNNYSYMLNSETEYFKEFYNVKLTQDNISVINKKINSSYSKKIGSKVKNIVETDKNYIENLTKNAKELGWTYDRLTQELDKSLESMSYNRSKTIAITETNTLTSEIDQETALEVDMSKKTWIHTGAGTTNRINHLKLDGSTIGIKEKFNLGGGVYALYPHDPSLPAKEVVNCYCMAIYE